MGWNENVKRILDFIPVFERESKKMDDLFVKLSEGHKAYLDAAKRIELLEAENKTITERLELIESIKPYNDKPIKEEIERFNDLFDSFRRTEGEQAATAISKIGKQVREIKREVDNIKPYDDSTLKKEVKAVSEAITKIKPYDDSEIKQSIKAINQTLKAVKPYDDKQIKKLISESSASTSEMISDHKITNSKEINDLLSKVEKQVTLMRDQVSELSGSIPEAYDDKQISDRIEKQNEAIKEISGEVSKIKKIFEV